MKIKNLITTALAAIMSVSAMSIPTFAENNTTIDEQLFVNTAKNAIYNYIVERGEEYYTISDVLFNDGDIDYEADNKVSFETVATVKQKLKASKVEELPYIQGYLNAAGLSSYADIQKGTAASSVLNNKHASIKHRAHFKSNKRQSRRSKRIYRRRNRNKYGFLCFNKSANSNYKRQYAA